MLVMFAYVLVPALASVAPESQYSVPLSNAAEKGMRMPLAGLGMPCGYKCPVCPGYVCSKSSYDATLTFLALGGRHTDSADSYTDAEPGIGLAMREWMAASPKANRRADLFIETKIGPGGGCWPLGYNESIAQAKMIIDSYNELPSSSPTNNITQLDLLLIHWPINCGACAIRSTADGHCSNTIPTTDPFCNVKSPTYSEKGCRISTWRGMLAVMNLGLARAVGVSNFNSTNMQDLQDAGLPLPAVNQIEWNPGIVPRPFVPYSDNHAETFRSLQAWCQQNDVVVNGYSPFGGNGHAAKTFSNPFIQAIAAAHNVSAAQAVLRWNVQQRIPVIPMATNPAYQAENLDIFGFNLTETEMECMATLNASICPRPLPTPAQAKCQFTLKGAGTITLKTLPIGPFTLTDRLGDAYAVTSPCSSVYSQGTSAPGAEDVAGLRIPLGFLSDLSTAPLPSHLVAQGGMRLILGGGDAQPGCSAGRILQYDMVCDKGGSLLAPPKPTMYIYDTPARKVDPIPPCTYVVEWSHPAACVAGNQAASTLGDAARADDLPFCSAQNHSACAANTTCCVASPTFYPVGHCCPEGHCLTNVTIAGPVNYCNVSHARHM